jgi:hypothetical protein
LLGIAESKGLLAALQEETIPCKLIIADKAGEVGWGLSLHIVGGWFTTSLVFLHGPSDVQIDGTIKVS